MDGNGRWATRRHLPRVAGHSRGVDAVRSIIENCGKRGVRFLTLFAFSSENWRRPQDEISTLMRLFVTALQKEVGKLIENGVRMRVVGRIEDFEPPLRALIREAEERTATNDRLHMTICASYGGRWDIAQAVQRLLRTRPELAHAPEAISEADLAPHLALAFAPEPDLLIRTGGEQRISNFLLWQAAYAELIFIDTLWPDFGHADLEAALAEFRRRERRYGAVGGQ